MAKQAGDRVIAPGEPNLQVFTADGTWNRPTGARAVLVEVVGGGGSGGGAAVSAAGQSAVGSGGGGGGYTRKLIQASALGTSETVTVGVGAAAGTAGANGGNTGGSSSFGSHCSATGGPGGLGSTSVANQLLGASSALGVGTGGDLNLQGGKGAGARIVGGVPVECGLGGNSQYGQGGTTAGSINSVAGNAGSGYGAGGSGGYNRDTGGTPARSGGAGTGGVVIVTTYF